MERATGVEPATYSLGRDMKQGMTRKKSDGTPCTSRVLRSLFPTSCRYLPYSRQNSLNLATQNPQECPGISAVPFTCGAAYAIAATLRYEWREPEDALELGEATIAVAQEHGFETFMAMGSIGSRLGIGREWPDCERNRGTGGNAIQVLANFQMQGPRC